MRDALPTVTPRTIIEAFLPVDGAVGLEIVYDTAAAVGVGDQPLRLGLRRMAAAGEIVVSGRGRRGTVSVTAAGRARLQRDRLGLQLALSQDAGTTRWDGNWRLLAVSAPEAERQVRDQLRRELTEAGAVSVSTGLFISPHDLTVLLDEAQRSHLVLATASAVDIRGERDPLAIAESLWPAAPVLAGYRRLASAVAQADKLRGDSQQSILATQLRLVEALDRALRHDPLIPPELRSNLWLATGIRRDWLTCWTRLADQLPDAILYRGWLSARFGSTWAPILSPARLG